MNIQIASDLHLEFLKGDHPGYLGLERTDADVLVLAGDIHSGTHALSAFADWPTPIVYVHGNHELYRQEITALQRRLRELGSEQGKVRFFENDELIMDGVRFLGACLWTDYSLYGNAYGAMAYARANLNDHRLIVADSAPGGRFQPEEALTVHQASRAWLAYKLAEPFTGKTVVVTHHGPHPGSIHPMYADDSLNPAFASDLSPLVEQADLWIHGHTHSSLNYRVGKCRVICNPRGYPKNRWIDDPAWLRFENAEFDPALQIEV